MDFQSIKPLQERAKELQCLYEIENILNEEQVNFEDIFLKIVRVIPAGWQIPALCHAIIYFEDKRFFAEESEVTEFNQTAELIVDNNIVGKITVFYKDLPFKKDAFLAEEQKLLNTIATRISIFIFNVKLEETVKSLSNKIVNKENISSLNEYKDEFWKWRFRMAEKIANTTNLTYYGIRAIYIIGSTKEATAGPASDIDLLIHFIGTDYQQNLLKSWMAGWSFSLEEINYQKTGYKNKEGLIDLHIITDDDIKNKTSFAVMIGNMNSPARLLKKVE